MADDMHIKLENEQIKRLVTLGDVVIINDNCKQKEEEED